MTTLQKVLIGIGCAILIATATPTQDVFGQRKSPRHRSDEGFQSTHIAVRVFYISDRRSRSVKYQATIATCRIVQMRTRCRQLVGRLVMPFDQIGMSTASSSISAAIFAGCCVQPS